MALEFEIIPYTLDFKFDAKTSRGSLTEHKTWLLKLWDNVNPSVVGYGESAPFEGLSIDDLPDFGAIMAQSMSELQGFNLPQNIEEVEQLVDQIDIKLPSVRFGLETALRDLLYGGKTKIFNSSFFNDSEPIGINGLVWMGDKETMLDRLELKIIDGFDCVKLKIGGIKFKDELEIIKSAKHKIDNGELRIRVDANGAFTPESAIEALNALSTLGVDSIEQPIKPGQSGAMADLVKFSPIPIALDEELIGIHTYEDKKKLLSDIKPQFIVLKPTLIGGFKATGEWIQLAEDMDIGWWITSALESNIGLNAICQFTAQYQPTIAQGLGTGGLYKNNIPSPLTIQNGGIFLDKSKKWDLNLIKK